MPRTATIHNACVQPVQLLSTSCVEKVDESIMPKNIVLITANEAVFSTSSNKPSTTETVEFSTLPKSTITDLIAAFSPPSTALTITTTSYI